MVSYSDFGGDNINIGFIGAGKVGFSFGKYLTENNCNVIGYYSNNIESAKEAAIFTKSKYFIDLSDLVNECDTIFITTPDGEIKKIWDKLKTLSIKNKIICHCSGSLSSKVFSNIEDYNSYGYSIHPMFAISNKYNSYLSFKKAFITIEGSKEKLDKIVNLINKLGNKFKIISSDNKELYHAASVVVSNHVIGLVYESINLLKKCGFNENEAITALYPLLLNNVENIGELGIVNSLTGPVERNDVETIKKHLMCLDEEDAELYKLLSKKLISIAKIKNKDRDYAEIESMMGE